MRTYAVALAFLVAALAGCSGSPTAQLTTTDSAGNPKEVCVDEAIRPVDCETQNATTPATVAKPDPVAMHDSGDLLQGGQHVWDWDVEPGFKRFTVALTVTGLQGAPQYVLTQEDVYLVGGEPSTTHFSQSGTVASSSSGCVVCFNGEDAEDTAAVPGPWRLSITTAPSQASYTLDVVVQYE